jgi:hypothetical protein
MRIILALGLVLVLLTTTAWAQSRDMSPNGWFRVSRAPQVNGATKTPRIEASVHHDGFVVESMRGAVTYRMTVISFDLVSLGQAP